MIHFTDVSKKYPNGVVALDNISIHVRKGDFIFLVGSSGAGKSTFIKLLLKEIEPSSGMIILDGQDTTKLHKRRVPYLRRKLGVVFQDFRLLNNRNVYENRALSLRIRNMDERDLKPRVFDSLKLVHLRHKADSFPTALSGGEQQRVAIARAAIARPIMTRFICLAVAARTRIHAAASAAQRFASMTMAAAKATVTTMDSASPGASPTSNGSLP